MTLSYSIVPGSIRHVKPVARDMRAALCASVMASNGNPRAELRRALTASSYCRTALLDGEPAAMWGMMGMLLSDQQTAWLALTERAVRRPVLIMQEARRELAAMRQAGGELSTNVARDDERAIALARSLGFRPSHSRDLMPGMIPMVFEGRRETEPTPLRKERVNGPPFVIHALGRSRTAWLSEFLSYGAWTCLHEQAMYLRHPHELKAILSRPRTGYAETAASFAWPLIRAACPDVMQIVINRHPDDVGAAMLAHYRSAGIELDQAKMAHTFERGARVLAKISALPGTLTIDYADLEQEQACRAVFESCLPYEWDAAWWREMDQRHVEADLPAIYAYFVANHDGIEDFKRRCRREMFRVVRKGEY